MGEVCDSCLFMIAKAGIPKSVACSAFVLDLLSDSVSDSCPVLSLFSLSLSEESTIILSFLTFCASSVPSEHLACEVPSVLPFGPWATGMTEVAIQQPGKLVNLSVRTFIFILMVAQAVCNLISLALL
jgi:hypothetical protein